jgi:hypothetical protein
MTVRAENIRKSMIILPEPEKGKKFVTTLSYKITPITPPPLP